MPIPTHSSWSQNEQSLFLLMCFPLPIFAYPNSTHPAKLTSSPMTKNKSPFSDFSRFYWSFSPLELVSSSLFFFHLCDSVLLNSIMSYELLRGCFLLSPVLHLSPGARRMFNKQLFFQSVSDSQNVN